MAKRYYQDGGWHEDIEDKPMSCGYRLLLWVLFVSSILMMGYGTYAWVTQKVIPLMVKLGEPFPTSPLDIKEMPTTNPTTTTTATKIAETTPKLR